VKAAITELGSSTTMAFRTPGPGSPPGTMRATGSLAQECLPPLDLGIADIPWAVIPSEHLPAACACCRIDSPEPDCQWKNRRVRVRGQPEDHRCAIPRRGAYRGPIPTRTQSHHDDRTHRATATFLCPLGPYLRTAGSGHMPLRWSHNSTLAWRETKGQGSFATVGTETVRLRWSSAV
jgi:hypothetical protein